jgi:RNase adaptor protein for sRNA GlmZ degradation
MAQIVTPALSSKSQRVASIVEALQSEGEKMTDEALEELQTTTDAMLAKSKGEVHIHVGGSGGTHIDVAKAQAA